MLNSVFVELLSISSEKTATLFLFELFKSSALFIFYYSYPQSLVLKDNCLFEQSVLQEFLRDCGQDASRLSGSFHQKPHSTMGLKPGEDFAIGGSANEITVESLKRMLAEDKSERKVEDDKKRLEILETFRTAPFEEIVARSEAKSNHFHNKLNEILDMVSRPPDSPEASRKSLEETSGPVFEMQFPDLFELYFMVNYDSFGPVNNEKQSTVESYEIVKQPIQGFYIKPQIKETKYNDNFNTS
ncbi:hypothetical protein KUTeg_016726 [Tegillarca granosa]|uniref:Uncharacterized protein n=1 Tax=Tegillarca granosa TaxID=220873 RepID=A0ABQ9EPA3_TEGGR|nr:hypothetical protein KUTeg_016726 [Tegillarca granosa]